MQAASAKPSPSLPVCGKQPSPSQEVGKFYARGERCGVRPTPLMGQKEARGQRAGEGRQVICGTKHHEVEAI